MFLVYKPAGASTETRYEFRPEKVKSSRASIAEKLYAKACGERRTWEQFIADAQQGSITARKVVLWLAQSEQHHTLRFEDMPDLETGQITMRYSKQELRRMREGIKDSAQMLDGEKQALLASLDAEIADAPAGSDEPDPEPELPEPGKDLRSEDEPSMS